MSYANEYPQEQKRVKRRTPAVTVPGSSAGRSLGLVLVFGSLLWLSGCTSGPLVHEPTPLPAVAPVATAPTPTPQPVGPPPEPSAESKTPVPSPTPMLLPPSEPVLNETVDEQRIAVTSEPAGARILVNNQPVGRAPLRLAVKITAQGFCVDYVNIRARFVAEDAAHVSQTIDLQLTPLEKPPSSLHFTPDGAQRRMK